jgi:hypothetical protein
MKTQTQQQGQKEARQPTHDVKLRRPNGEKATYERIGAAWGRDDGSLFVRLNGTQIVSEGFYLFPIEEDR